MTSSRMPTMTITIRRAAALAQTLDQLGRIPEAKSELERSIAISPGFFDRYVRQRPPWQRLEITPFRSKACARPVGRVDDRPAQKPAPGDNLNAARRLGGALC
jgi:hypothetical protein